MWTMPMDLYGISPTLSLTHHAERELALHLGTPGSQPPEALALRRIAGGGEQHGLVDPSRPLDK